MTQYLVIADDFTGSNDTGVQMSKRGIATEVILFPKDKKVQRSIVLDTESRTMAPDNAYNTVRNLTEQLCISNEFNLIYKKIDSTLRGNIAQEIKAVSDVYKPDQIIFAPAFPKINRTTKNGTHMIDGVPLMNTELINDPLNPLWTDNVVDILKKEFEGNIQHYSTSSISENLVLENKFVHTFDIETTEDLEILSKTLLKSCKKTLFVGSAGLADAIFKQLHPPLPTLSVVGSISSVSLNQVNYAEDMGVNVVKIDINDLIDNNAVNKYANIIIEKLKVNKDVIVTVTRSKDDYNETLELFKKLKDLDKVEVSRLVKIFLANIAKIILEKQPVSGLFLIGGDTAIEVIQKLNSSGCLIDKELNTGIVKSNIVGGRHEGLTVVTKAGAFGNKEDLLTTIKKIRQ